MKTITIEQIRDRIDTYVKAYPLKDNSMDFWREPLVATAAIDERFNILPDIAAPDHALPSELLPSGKTVIVFFIPFSKALARENHLQDTPCRNWAIAYQQTNQLINSLCKHLQDFLNDAGYVSALVPATHNFDKITLMSRWSHKHIGYISGLGRFGVNAQFITPSGCAGRMGSFVTEADIGNHPLVREKELCLYKTGRSCLVCVKRCPVGAVSEDSGIDRQKCWSRLNDNLNQTKALAGLGKDTHVCGKCQVLVPCSLKAP